MEGVRSPRVSVGVPTVLGGLDEVLYREAEERRQRQAGVRSDGQCVMGLGREGRGREPKSAFLLLMGALSPPMSVVGSVA